MGDWSRTAVRAQESENDRTRYSNQPYVANIRSVDPAGETVTVDLPFGDPTSIPIPQPMLSDGAWIRAIPDGVSQVLVSETADGGVPSILRWFSATSLQKARTFESIAAELRADPSKKDSASKATSLFRSLKTGEIQMANRAGAEVFLRSDGSLNLRGGPVSRNLEATDGEAFDRAPLHRRTGLLSAFGSSILDEERFGTVKRADPDKAAFRDLPILIDNPQGFTPPPANGGGVAGAVSSALSALLPQSAAKEHLVNLAYDGLPPILYDRRVGHVFEDGATKQSDQVKSADTGQKLRDRIRWFTTPLGNKVELVVDELGNMVATFPDEGIVGLIVRMGKVGNINLTTMDFIVTALRNLVLTVTGQATISGTAGVEINTPVVMDLIADVLLSLNSKTAAEVNAPVVVLGEGLADATPIQGVMTGESKDPFSGRFEWEFGNGSNTVAAKK